MTRYLAILGVCLFSAASALAGEIDSCTTFVDEPPGTEAQLLCDKEKQHAAELGLPVGNEQTVLTLNDLAALGWTLHSLQRFRTANGAYAYRVYLVRER